MNSDKLVINWQNGFVGLLIDWKLDIDFNYSEVLVVKSPGFLTFMHFRVIKIDIKFPINEQTNKTIRIKTSLLNVVVESSSERS